MLTTIEVDYSDTPLREVATCTTTICFTTSMRIRRFMLPHQWEISVLFINKIEIPIYQKHEHQMHTNAITCSKCKKKIWHELSQCYVSWHDILPRITWDCALRFTASAPLGPSPRSRHRRDTTRIEWNVWWCYLLLFEHGPATFYCCLLLFVVFFVLHYWLLFLFFIATIQNDFLIIFVNPCLGWCTLYIYIYTH